jgi:hypothetical protein
MPVKAVCSECNSGWMNEVDSAAKAVVRAVFPSGARQHLSPADQKTLATWIVKVSMVMEYRQPHEVLAPQSHRTWMFKKREPPRNSRIWIAAWQMPDVTPGFVGEVDTVPSPSTTAYVGRRGPPRRQKL